MNISRIIIVLIISYALFAGIYLLLLSFGILRRKFKDVQKQINFDRKLIENRMLFRVGTIAYIILLVILLIQTNILNQLLNQIRF